MMDRAWITETRQRLGHASAALNDALSSIPLRILGGTALFRLVEVADAATVAEQLGRNGILVRAFETRPRWLRLGLPPDDASTRRLIDTLKTAITDPS